MKLKRGKWNDRGEAENIPFMVNILLPKHKNCLELLKSHKKIWNKNRLEVKLLQENMAIRGKGSTMNHPWCSLSWHALSSPSSFDLLLLLRPTGP